MHSEVTEAVRVLRDGGIVIFPTDTAFAIGCRIDNEESIERLFKMRKRPVDKATSVLIDSIDMGKKYLQPFDEGVMKLMVRYWPGALTIVLTCNKDKVPSLVRGSGSTLGVRIPNHETARSIISAVGVPLLGPSANFANNPTPYDFRDIDNELMKLVDFVVKGETKFQKVSTVIDCSRKPWKILREGAIELKV